MPISLHLINQGKDKPEKSPKGPRRPVPKEKEALLQDDPSASPATPVGGNRRILIVDDNPVVLKAFELKLKSDGFVVTTSTNSATVASTAEQTHTQLIILDINFPAGGAMEWNGFTVIQWMRRFPELTNIPIILITGSEAAEYKDKALAAGAIAFFQKPVVYKDLLETILKIVPVPAAK